MISSSYKISFLWVPPDLNGHPGPPWEGLRANLEIPSRRKFFLENGRTASLTEIEYDAKSMRGMATMTLMTGDLDLTTSDVLEFTGGYNILALGRIVGQK